MNVLIKHKIFEDQVTFSQFISKLVGSDIITSVHKRITTKYANLPFSIRIRPHNSYRYRECSVIQDEHFITFYVDENVTLPSRIQTHIDSLTDTMDTVGQLQHFTYLGEILPSFHLHLGFYRGNQFYRKNYDYYQTSNDNCLVTLKLYDEVNVLQIVDRINKNPGGYINYYHTSPQKFNDIELNTYEIEELYQAQRYYEYILTQVQQLGEIKMLSQLIQNITDFGPHRFKKLFESSTGEVK